jgi:hypothetical protein
VPGPVPAASANPARRCELPECKLLPDGRVRSIEAALVRDWLKENTIEWKPKRYQEHYRKYAMPFDWCRRMGRLLLDGWKPL